jgi:hypothetical protein
MSDEKTDTIPSAATATQTGERSRRLRRHHLWLIPGIVGALAWLGHIVVGWGTGDRIKSVVEPGIAGSRGARSGRLELAPGAAGRTSR